MSDKQILLRQLPAVDRLLHHPTLLALAERCPRRLLLEAAQETVTRLRQQILAETPETPVDLGVAAVALQVAASAEEKMRPSLRPVINATGTLLHTNLGRAPLAVEALAAIEQTARGFSNLEFDLRSGERGQRSAHIEELLCRLTGAEAAIAVNNCAGAVLLSLSALATGREAIVSRGELVEIGGAFRIPDVMAASGVALREVGTTNKTHLRDYQAAIGEKTGLLLKVHTSNYRVVGFTSAVPAAELVELGREQRLPVMEDLGSGMLLDLSAYGLPREPTVSEAIASGLDLVTFSGDKLLGGPQAGIIIGRSWALEKIRRHPLARALRMDKLTLAALEATLRLYLDPATAVVRIPVLRMLAMPADELHGRCRRLARRLKSAVGDRLQISIIPGAATVGGGALPLTELPGPVLALQPADFSIDEFAIRLRRTPTPLIGRAQEGRLLLDLRTVAADEEGELLRAICAALAESAR
jgi:L-seryl-tRNA(Ser) seleniumtransferase